MPILRDYLPAKTYAVVCAYSMEDFQARVGACSIRQDDSLHLHFPKDQPFVVGQAVTVHLDNRTGPESFDIELKVYRGSYKGIVAAVSPDRIDIQAVHYQLFFGTSLILESRRPDYAFPTDFRPDQPLPASPLSRVQLPDEREAENKLGVWITRAPQRPHTTVMAFLSSANDDIFVISHRGTYKSLLIHRDPRCCFAIDHRASFLFEKAIDWNFSIIKARASLIDRSNPLFAPIQASFVEKNPWEQPFFTDPKVELFHLLPEGLLCSSNGN